MITLPKIVPVTQWVDIDPKEKAQIPVGKWALVWSSQPNPFDPSRELELADIAYFSESLQTWINREGMAVEESYDVQKYSLIHKPNGDTLNVED